MGGREESGWLRSDKREMGLSPNGFRKKRRPEQAGWPPFATAAVSALHRPSFCRRKPHRNRLPPARGIQASRHERKSVAMHVCSGTRGYPGAHCRATFPLKGRLISRLASLRDWSSSFALPCLLPFLYQNLPGLEMKTAGKLN